MCILRKRLFSGFVFAGSSRLEHVPRDRNATIVECLCGLMSN